MNEFTPLIAEVFIPLFTDNEKTDNTAGRMQLNGPGFMFNVRFGMCTGVYVAKFIAKITDLFPVDIGRISQFNLDLNSMTLM